MNDIEIQDFVTRFAAAWAARDGEAFLALWARGGVGIALDTALSAAKGLMGERTSGHI